MFDRSASDTTYTLAGDSFKNTSAQTWFINTIRLWTVGSTDTAILRCATEGSSSFNTIPAAAYANATYADGSTFQGNVPMYQVDFAVNITLGAGQTYDFFLDGTGGY